MLVVSRRKTERGTDTEGEEGIMLQAAEAGRVEAAEAAEAAEKIPFQDVAASRSSSAASGCLKAAPVHLLYFPAVAT